MRRRKQKSTRQTGFTLVEVMMATGVFTVGALTVLVVLATAAGFASWRQQKQRLAQVLEEAKSDASSVVDAFQPTPEKRVPGDDQGELKEKSSTLYSGYAYALRFTPVDKAVPEAGYEVEAVIHYGDEQEYRSLVYVSPDVVPDIEFVRSITFEEELAGADTQTGGSER